MRVFVTGSMPRTSSAWHWRRPRRDQCYTGSRTRVCHTIAEVIGRHLDLPVVAISPSDASEHFSWLGQFFSIDNPTSSMLTRKLLGWRPVHPALIPDLEEGHYFEH